MRVFNDADGRAWNLDVTLPEIKRVKERLGVQVLDLADVKGELFQRATGDVIFLVDLLYVLCEPQAGAAKIDDEQFGRAMRGDAIEEATDALFLAIADFFPKGRRALLESLHQKLARYGKMAQAVAGEELARAETDEQVRLNVLSALRPGSNASGSPDSSASIPLAPGT